MSEFLTQSELAERLVRKTGVSPEVAKRFASVFFTIVRTGLKSSDRFSVYNFGTFKKTWIETSVGQNPFTGEKMEIPAHWRIKFIPCAAVAKRVNRPFNHLKPKVIKEKNVSSDGLLARADRLSQKKEDGAEAENRFEDENVVVQEHQYDADEEFYTPVPAIIPDECDDGQDDIGFDDDEEEEEKKPWKCIAFISFGILLLILLISLLIKSCSPKKNKPRSDVVSAEEIPVDSAVEERAAEHIRNDSETEEKAAAELFEMYTVPSGMSYHQIAEKCLGDRHLWPLLYVANKDISVNPDFVPVSASIKIPAVPRGADAEKKIASAVLDAYNAYLLMTEKEPDSPKNEERRKRAVRVIVSGEILCPGFIDVYQARILPDYAQSARKIAAHQYVSQD